MSAEHFERQVPFLTPEGQDRIGRTRVAVVGNGGLGAHVVQQLAYTGVVNLSLIDADRVSRNNLNRFVTAFPGDVDTLKVEALRRFVLTLHPGADVRVVRDELRSHAAYAALKEADYLVGCFDDDGPRFLLNQLAAAYQKPYLDVSSEIGADQTSYGGKFVFSRPGQGCLHCRGLLDHHEIRRWLETPEEKKTRERIYGQQIGVDGSGPSVVALNGVVASLGVMELMLDIAGIRPAHDYRKYIGVLGMIVTPSDNAPDPASCRICGEVCGQGDRADLEQYIRERP
jgi:hypothetical protein